MSHGRLSILHVSPMPASPPRFGAQVRMHGLMTELARRHDLTAVMLVDNEFDAEECRKTMQAYCRDVVLVPKPYVGEGLGKRLFQLQALASTRSWERWLASVPAMQRALDRVLRAERFDLVNLEFSFLGECNLRQAPRNERLPRLVVASHNIDYELARQYARDGRSLAHRLYAGVNWRKLRREELGTYRDADGVYLCSAEEGKAIVSTALGSEGIEAIPGRDLLIEDQPEAFGDALNRLLDDPELAARIGQSARSLAVERYSWSGAARALEGFYRDILDAA